MTSENPIPKNDPSPDASRKTDQQTSYAKSKVAPTLASSQLPPSHANYQITCKQEKDWWDRWKPFMEILGIILLAVYTGYTIKMYRANRDSADAAKGAAITARNSLFFTQSEFRMDQRPYLSAVARAAFAKPTTTGIDTGQVPFGYTTKSKRDAFFSAAVDLRNIGKSPAINVVHTRTDYIYAPRDYARKAAKAYRPDFNSAATIVAMGEFITPQTPNRIPLTPDQAHQLLNGAWEIYVVGGVQYTDIFSPAIPPYETDYCFKIRISGMPYANCEWQAPDFTSSIK